MKAPVFGCEAEPFFLADGRIAIAIRRCLIIVREQEEPIQVPPVIPPAPPGCEVAVVDQPVARFRGGLTELWAWVQEDEEAEDIFRRLSNGVPRTGRLCGVKLNRDLLWLGLITAETPPDGVVVVELVDMKPSEKGTAHEVLRIRGWDKDRLLVVSPLADVSIGVKDSSLDLEPEASA